MSRAGLPAMRLTPDGIERWRAYYDLEDCGSPERFHSVIQGHDNTIVACGTVSYRRDERFTPDGILMKLEFCAVTCPHVTVNGQKATCDETVTWGHVTAPERLIQKVIVMK